MSINNLVIICGRLTKNIEIKNLSNNMVVGKFSLAINRMQKETEVDFINCTAWKHTANYLEKYAKQGDLIQVVGEIRTNRHENVTYTEINVDQATIRAKKGGNTNNDEAETETETYQKSSLPPKKEVYKQTNTEDYAIEDDKPF